MSVEKSKLTPEIARKAMNHVKRALSAPIVNGKPHRKFKNRKGKPAKRVFRRGGTAPLKEYTSVCCGAEVTKPATGKPVLSAGKQELKDAGFKVPGEKTAVKVHGLGGWRCKNCNKPTKVKVTLVKPAPEPEAAS